MIRFRGLIVATIAAVAMGVVGTGNAAAETATSSTKITERAPLFKDFRTAVDVHLEAKVIPDPGATKLRELNNTKLNLPKDLTFSTEGTPVCEKDIGQINPENANRSTEAVIAECPDSVVGGGTAVINVAGLVAAPITDPVLTVFNGGKDAQGDPILLIHGYSATVLPGGHGIPMKGSLKNGVLDVSVPTLAANSAVTEFTFDLPGTVGRDQNYSQAKCSTGSWSSNAVLTLGRYDPNTGTYVDKIDLVTDPTTQTCTGLPGKARFGSVKVKGPKSVKKGKKGTYKVTVKNIGTAIAKGVKIAASGKGASGKASGGNIAPGASKTISVKVKFSKKGTAKVKFKATASKVSAKTGTFKVKVK